MFQANFWLSHHRALSTLITKSSTRASFGVIPARKHSTLFGGGPNISSADVKSLKRVRTSMSQAQLQPMQPNTVPPSINEVWQQNVTGESWLDGVRDKTWFTGKPPVFGLCPGVNKDGVLSSLPMPDLNNVTRESAQNYFDNTWTLYETMFSGLKGETPFYCPPQHGLRHPQIFYYGHTTCFYVNKLQVAGILTEPVDPYLESICEVGVDEMLWDDMHHFDDPWPAVERVFEYRKKVYKIVSNIIAEHPCLDDSAGPIKVTQNDPLWALFMGCEHERIHLETSSVLFREMPLAHVQPPSNWPPPAAPRTTNSQRPIEGVHFPSNELISVKGGSVDIGKPRDHPSYGWDNEYGSRTVKVPAFAASKHMVTNGEYWHFVNSGGYLDEKYWCASGWAWRKFRNSKWPFFWEQNGPQGSMKFKLRTVFEIGEMQWANPVEVNYYEAKAFCSWKSENDGLHGKPEAYRVITEAEHNLIRPKAGSLENVRKDPLSDRIMSHSGHEFAEPNDSTNANLNLAFGSTTPVDMLKPSETGHFDTMGNAWEWTEDHFNPLEGFEFHSYYNDFSTPCFDGKHNMIMGGSFASTGLMAGTFGRFHFRPHFLQHSGFRVVSSSNAAPATHLSEKDTDNSLSAGAALYETDDLVHQYLGFHFAHESGKAEGISAILPHANAPAHALRFPQRVAELLTSLSPVKTNGRVLDVGCSVGGSAFELATKYDSVVAFDFSQAFINAALKMQCEGSMKFMLSMEADIFEPVVAVHETHVDQAARSRITFQTGDACEMEKLEGTFDGAVVANLLCRVPQPLKVLDGLAAKINPGGVVVLATPFSWLETYTEKENWLGGYRNEQGGALYSKDQLLAEMTARGFEKIHEDQLPVLIREHQRKYQYILSEATGWRKL